MTDGGERVDLLRAVLALTCTRSAQLVYAPGHYVHGWLFRWLSSVSPALAALLHDRSGRPQPFGVTGLMGNDDPSRGGRTPRQGAAFEVGICSHSATFTELLLERLPACRELVLGGGRFEVTGVAVHQQQHPRAVAVSSGNLLAHFIAGTQTPARVLVDFEAPTTFRSGSRSLPLPVPASILEGLAERWANGTRPPIPPDLVTGAARSILLSRHRLYTAPCRFPRYTILGFEGECVFELPPEEPAAAAAAALLFAFAPFAGIGYKCSMGMGQVWTRPEGTLRSAGLTSGQ